jgi:hypothetical protein
MKMDNVSIGKITLVCIFLFWCTIHGRVNSGIFILLYPNNELQIPIDFSYSVQPVLLGQKITSGMDTAQISGKEDIIIIKDSIIAPYGIISTTIPHFHEKHIAGKEINSDFQSIFYLDSIVKYTTLKVNSFVNHSDFTNSANIRDSILLIKTREGGFAVLLKTSEYIGGINRNFYYWIYQNSNDSTLYKDTIIKGPDSIRIALDIFSGRPNPVFSVYDQCFIQELTAKLYATANRYLNPSLQISSIPKMDFGNQGYRSMIISGFDKIESHAQFTFSDSTIVYSRGSWIISAYRPTICKDEDNAIASFILQYGINHDLKTRDMYGEISFKELMKNTTPIHPEKIPANSHYNISSKNNIRILKVNNQLDIFSKPGTLELSISDLKGRILQQYRLYTSGTCRFAFNNNYSQSLLFVNCKLYQNNGTTKSMHFKMVK